MSTFYIFDIDGTLSDCSHRMHYIEEKPKNWPAYLHSCDKDIPISAVVSLFDSMDEKHYLFFMTGRSEEAREKTVQWLKTHCKSLSMWTLDEISDMLYMRKAKDYRPDYVVKKELFEELLQKENLKKEDCLGVFEDREQVIKMWREQGIFVFDVNQQVC